MPRVCRAFFERGSHFASQINERGSASAVHRIRLIGSGARPFASILRIFGRLAIDLSNFTVSEGITRRDNADGFGVCETYYHSKKRLWPKFGFCFPSQIDADEFPGIMP